LIIHLFHGNNSATVEIRKHHTYVVRIEKNGTILYEEPNDSGKYLGSLTDRSCLNVDDILSFAESVDLSSVKPLLETQISYNMAIAEEGLTGNYGVGIGRVIRNTGSACPSTELKARTAAASEARMSGCTLPVITNSGSGNQGIASSVPVIVYARSKGYSDEKLLRALVLSNLLTIHQKTPIGRLSAFCGVVSATCSSGAAITWLDGGSPEQVKMTISNTLANSAGIICDGAKPSCGAKIASSLDAAFIGHLLAMQGRAYNPGDGILKDDIEETIAAVGHVAYEGMRSTAGCILNVMLDC
jgi:L-cysteine desulfidase